jgi:ABC-type phosphate transport system substrate-binding protein
MTSAIFRSSVLRWAAAPALALVIPLIIGAAPAGAASYVAISGSGSSWSSIAIGQWAQHVRPAGIVVNYNPDGSGAGRLDYATNQDDYAASDPPFRSSEDKLCGCGAEHSPYGYSYIPDVAGGTAFPYHITSNGHLVTDLRLSPRTLMGIFTGKITNWDDPQITRDYGHRLPNLAIIPVVHAELDGGTYFFTRWMAHIYPSQWNAFCDKVHPGITPPCGPTEVYPTFGNAKAENGSTNVMNYLTSTFGNGSIGYVEYAYALASHVPVVELRNPAGRYVLPNAANVTTALTQAVINERVSSRNFLQQNLNRVYTYTNPASYPLASYSYLIVPREGTPLPPNFTKAKGRTLSAFAVFALCGGQRMLNLLGYAPLPRTLVRGGLIQAAHIPGHGPIPTPAQCAGARKL